jgi:hypothetical protein
MSDKITIPEAVRETIVKISQRRNQLNLAFASLRLNYLEAEGNLANKLGELQAETKTLLNAALKENNIPLSDAPNWRLNLDSGELSRDPEAPALPEPKPEDIIKKYEK